MPALTLTDKILKTNTYDLVKILAIFLMIIDHIGLYLYPNILEFRLVGRFSFPLFFFLIGYNQSYKFSKELFFWASLIFLVDVKLNYYLIPLNILFSVIFTRLILSQIIKKELKSSMLSFYIILFSILNLPLIFLLEYGSYGVLFALLGVIVKFNINKNLRYLLFGVVALSYGYLQVVFFKFNLFYSCLLVLGLAGFMLGLNNFKNINIGNIFLNNRAIVFLSRNSLYIFVLHVILFKFFAVSS